MKEVVGPNARLVDPPHVGGFLRDELAELGITIDPFARALGVGRVGLHRILAGQGTHQDLDTLLDACDNLLGRSFCALGDGATSPVTSSIQYFKQDYVDYIEGRTAPKLRSGDLVGAH